MRGIDIYSGDGTVDFNAVKAAGIDIVYIKATEGVSYTDSTDKDFYNRAKAAGLKVGFYHFLRNNDPIAEANHFISAVQGLSVDCKYSIDVEVTLGQSVYQISNNVKQFADYLISKGYEICIYTYTSFYLESLNNTVKSYPIWIADYRNTEPNIVNVGWQYSETGSVHGVNSNCDLDNFNDTILIGGGSVIHSVEKSIQGALNQLLITDADGQPLVVDGDLNTKSVYAINKFKAIMGLTQDGKWDSACNDAWSRIVTKPLLDTEHYAQKYVQFRMFGPDFSKITGEFDQATSDQVKVWQNAFKVSAPTGIVDLTAWNHLITD